MALTEGVAITEGVVITEEVAITAVAVLTKEMEAMIKMMITGKKTMIMATLTTEMAMEMTMKGKMMI